jgi:hypothetical protein
MLFFENMFLHSPLETISLDMWETTGIRRLFKSGSVGDVTKLYIHCKVLPEDWDHLSKLRMPKIRELAFRSTANDVRDYAQHYVAVLSNGAETVESLRGTFIPFEMLSTFPKLREINCRIWGAEFSEMTAERFPSLKSVSFEVTIESFGFRRSVRPHFGVKQIELFVRQDSREGPRRSPGRDHQDLLHRTLRCTRSQFPSVVELKLGSHFKLLTSTVVATVHACFPRLKVLDLRRTEADFETLSGYQVNLESWLEFGFPLEMAPLHGSLQSFEHLENIMLGEKISVSENLVKYCLSKVVKLKCLEFEWEEGLSPETIRDYLGHVELIRLTKCSFFKNKTLREKNRILAMVPGIFIDHDHEWL